MPQRMTESEKQKIIQKFKEIQRIRQESLGILLEVEKKVADEKLKKLEEDLKKL